MAGNIKGITIEFRGDTTKLSKALREIDKETRQLDKELKNVDKALKFNPTNVDLWRQKQELLTKKVGDTKEKLDLLKKAQKDMDAQGVEKTSEEYMKLERQIIETESKLKTFNGQLKQVGSPQAQATAAQFGELGNKLTSAGQAMTAFSAGAAAVEAALIGMAVKSASLADDLNTMSKVYGISTAELQKYQAIAGLVDVDVETIAKSHTKLAKSMNSAREGTGETAEAFAALGVNVLDANGELRNADDVWNETISALGEVTNETERDVLAMQLMGKSAQELNPLILDNGEAYKQLSDTMSQYGLEFVDQETIDKANEFQDKIDTIKAIGTTTFFELGATLAGHLAPALDTVVGWVGSLSEWLTSLDPQVLTFITVIAGLIAVLAPILIFAGKLAFAIQTLIPLFTSLGAAIAAAEAPILPIIAAIAALIAIGVLLYKHWDEIKAWFIETWETIKKKVSDAIEYVKQKVKAGFEFIKQKIIDPVIEAKNAAIEKFNELKQTISDKIQAIKDTVTEKFEAIKEKITEPIRTAKEKIKGFIDDIKGFFNFDWELPKIKLPHFSVSGSANPINWITEGVPKISVDWYKTGGIFNSPSIIGVGEAGSEAVVPLDKFWSKMDRIQGGNTFNISMTINGAEDPQAWARKFVRELELEMRSK